MAGEPDIAVVLHPRRDPGQVLEAIGSWTSSHGRGLDSDRYQRRNQVKLSLLDLPFLPDELRELEH